MQMPLTPARIETFLKELALYGIVTRACKAASPGAKGSCSNTFLDRRNKDPEFVAAWDAALDDARAGIEHEVYRRGQEGWEEPVFGGPGRTEVVGHVRKFSDRLLELRLKALIPAYREHTKLDLETKEASPTLADVRELSSEEKKIVKDALARIKALREKEKE